MILLEDWNGGRREVEEVETECSGAQGEFLAKGS